MKLLANENIPLASVKLLRKKGYDTIYIGQNFQGIQDREVISLAINENRTIITLDSDYGELIFKHGLKPPAGIIYIRLSDYKPEQIGEIISDLISTDKVQFYNRLTVVDKNSIRQRKY